MSRITRPALRGTLLGRVLRELNPLVRRLLSSRLHWPLSRRLALLRWIRPGTGRRRTLPLSYIREGGTVYLTTADRWSGDFRSGREVTIRLRGRWRAGRAAVVADRAEAAAIFGRLFRQYPWFRALAGIPRTSGGGADARALEQALSAGRVLLRVSLGVTGGRSG